MGSGTGVFSTGVKPTTSAKGLSVTTSQAPVATLSPVPFVGAAPKVGASMGALLAVVGVFAMVI